MAKSILMLNGPNLNLLGTREPTIYGHHTLTDVITAAATQCAASSASFAHYQSNSEGSLVDRIHAARTDGTTAIVINAGALTHTSVALRDALVGVDIPFVEVHVSNVYKREAFRHKSFLADKAEAVICGMGVYGYEAAVGFCLGHLKERGKL